MTDWASGYSSEWRVMRVDPKSWGDVEELKGITDIKIDRNCTDKIPLLESATLNCDISVNSEFQDGWYRIEMLAKQGDFSERHSIATLLLQSGNGYIDRGYKNVSIDGYSVLKPAADALMTAGVYMPKGFDVSSVIKTWLARCTPAPVVFDKGFSLEDNYVFPIGSSYIEAIWTILDAGNHVIQIDGEGVIHIIPKPTEPSLDLSTANARMIIPGIDYELDLSEVPNRYIVYYGEKSHMEVNADPNSRTSTISRGRNIDYIDTDPVLLRGETLESYATRRLTELSTVFKKYSYTREYVPDILPFSIVKGGLEMVELLGDFRVLGQTLNCGKGITVAEKVGMEVQVYTA